MSVFFNGRLWTSPATMSAVNDSAMNNQNLAVGNTLAIIGRSSGGAPNTPLRFGRPSEAVATLRDGELLTAVLKAFDPSAQTNGPAEVVAIRLNPAVQSSLALLDSVGGSSVNLVSTDYGLYTNQIKVKVEAGSVSGLKLTSQFGNGYFTADNVGRRAMSIQYTGVAATAIVSTTGTTMTLQAPTGTTLATIDLASFPTVDQVVDRINSVTGFSAATLDGNGTKPTLNGLDFVTAQDVKTAAYTVQANLQAVVDWFNSNGEGFVTATRATGAGKVPTTLPFTYLAGGSDGIITNTEWSNAYSTLQTVDVQWVVPVSADPSIHAMNDAHCKFASDIMFKERRGIVGMALGTTDLAAVAAAKAINSDRTSLVHLGVYDYDANGLLTLFPPYILAALLGGAFAGSSPGTALTNKSIKVRGLERDLRNPTDTDQLINGGVLAVENTETGYKVVQSISTWLTNDNYNRVEVSCGVALDYVARTVRTATDVLRGEKGSPITLGRAVSLTQSALNQLARPEPQGPGVIVGDATNPAFKNITATLEGDVIAVTYQCSPVIPVNFVTNTIYAVPYSGSASI